MIFYNGILKIRFTMYSFFKANFDTADLYLIFCILYSSDNQGGTDRITVENRGGTEFREVIASRRKFNHPLYAPPGTYHYDIAIIELGKEIN